MSTLCSSVVGATLSVLCLLFSSASADEASAGSEKLRALQKEKIAILEASKKQCEADYSDGRVSIQEVIRASNQLLKAKLPLTKDKATRLAILKERVEIMTRWERIAVRNFRAGEESASAASIQKIRIKKLNAQIALVREEEKP